MNRAERRFYAAWILANARAEGLGLSSTLLLAHFAAGVLKAAAPGAGSILAGAVLAVVLGTLLEGTLVGYAQAHVLTARLKLSAGRWIAATSLGAGIAWALGMAPGTAAALQGLSAGATAGASPADLSIGAVLLFATLLGALLGPVLALPQWRVLRTRVPGAWRWLPANAFAWAAGLAIVFAGMHQVVWSRGLPATLDAVFTICTLAGGAVGTLHGWVLVRLLRDAEAASGNGFRFDERSGTAARP